METLPSLHPFPARMAPEITLEWIPESPRLTVLDPMCGSGTTILTSWRRGHRSVGVDSDPLARLITRTAVSDFDELNFQAAVQGVIGGALDALHRNEPPDVPPASSLQTQKFMKFWFDEPNRKELTALAAQISAVDDEDLRDQMLVAMSRTIVTKKTGVSLAADVSHSRPHRVYETAPVRALAGFEKQAKVLERRLKGRPENPWRNTKVKIIDGDARRLSLRASSVDTVVTSPPYLTGIDYMRGHKLSLVWMGYDLEQLSGIRASNIGSERAAIIDTCVLVDQMADSLGDVDRLSRKIRLTLERYLGDMTKSVSEIGRVTRTGANIVMVLGNATVDGVFLNIAKAVELLAAGKALSRVSAISRAIPDNRRYLPPPDSQKEGQPLAKRLREEIVLVLKNEGSPPTPIAQAG